MADKQKAKPIKKVSPPPQTKNYTNDPLQEFDVEDLMEESDPAKRKRMFESGAVSPSYIDTVIGGGLGQGARILGSKVIPAVGTALSRFLSTHPKTAATAATTSVGMDLANMDESVPSTGALDKISAFAPLKKPLPPVPEIKKKVSEKVPVAVKETTVVAPEDKVMPFENMKDLEGRFSSMRNEALMDALGIKKALVDDFNTLKDGIKAKVFKIERDNAGERADKLLKDYWEAYGKEKPKLKYESVEGPDAKGRTTIQSTNKMDNPWTEGKQSRTFRDINESARKANEATLAGKPKASDKILKNATAKDFKAVSLSDAERATLRQLYDNMGKPVKYDEAKHKALWQTGKIKVQDGKIVGITDLGMQEFFKKGK
jgi:hypothetical protein